MIFARRFNECLTLALAVVISCVPAVADEVIRIMAANTTSGNNSSYDPGEGNRIFQGLDPDIALVQELNVGIGTPGRNSQATYRAWVNANFGTTFSFYVEPSTSNGDIPNGIVSRYPIISSGEWDDTTMTNRDFVWAKIDIPGDKDLWAVSVHLSSGGGSSQRNAEAGQIRTAILSGLPATSTSPAFPPIPAADYLVIGGDFNTDTRSESCVTTLSDVVVVTGPYPIDRNDADAAVVATEDADTNASRAKPYDWVMPDSDLNARKTPLIIAGKTYTNGLVLDSRVYSPLADVSPILLADSGASNMQHMAVMRAFLIPANNPPLIVSAANSSSTETVTEPDSSVYEIVRGTSVGLSVTASDDAGEAALKYTWSKTGGSNATVTFSANGTNAAKNSTATFQSSGDYTLTATVQDVPGLSVISSVKVRVVQTAASLVLNPPSATLAVDATQAFTATLLDQFNQTVPGAFTWSASGGGSVSASGVFTATAAGGPYDVTASRSGFSDTSSVTVTKAVASVTLANLSQVYDGSAKPVTVTTTPAGKPVSVLYAGSSTAPINAGNYVVIATITDDNYQGGASGTLVITPDPWAFWKNAYFTPLEQTAGLAMDGVDPDFDGLSNLAEYALDANPRQFTPPLPGVIDAVGFSITFTRPAGLPGLRYFAEASDDLLTWSLVPLELMAPGPIETLRAREPFGVDPAMPMFLRLRFERD